MKQRCQGSKPGPSDSESTSVSTSLSYSLLWKHHTLPVFHLEFPRQKCLLMHFHPKSNPVGLVSVLGENRQQNLQASAWFRGDDISWLLSTHLSNRLSNELWKQSWLLLGKILSQVQWYPPSHHAYHTLAFSASFKNYFHFVAHGTFIWRRSKIKSTLVYHQKGKFLKTLAGSVLHLRSLATIKMLRILAKKKKEKFSAC